MDENYTILEDEDDIGIHYGALNENNEGFHTQSLSLGSQVFVALNSDNEIVGTLTLMPPASMPGFILIKDLFVKEGYRGSGVGRGLLEFALNICKQAGFNVAIAKVVGDTRSMLDVNRFFASEAFLPSNLKGKVLTYETKAIENSSFKELSGKISLKKNVPPFSKLDKTTVKRFLLTHNKKSFYLPAEEIDADLSYAVLEENEINAAIICKKDKDNYVVMTVFIKPGFADKHVSLKLLSAIFKKALKEKIDNIIINTTDPRIERGFSTCGVHYKEKLLVHEYVKKL